MLPPVSLYSSYYDTPTIFLTGNMISNFVSISNLLPLSFILFAKKCSIQFSNTTCCFYRHFKCANSILCSYIPTISSIIGIIFYSNNSELKTLRCSSWCIALLKFVVSSVNMECLLQEKCWS